MTIFTEKDPTYNITDLGFDKSLVRADKTRSLLDSVTPELRNIFSEGIAPKNIISGELAAALDQVLQFLHSGKDDFSITDTGYILGIDPVDGLAKFYLGNSVNYLYFDGTNLILTGGTVLGVVGGFIVTATTLIGGSLVLDSTNQNIKAGSANDILIIDADDATDRLSVGNAIMGSAPFRVSKTGVLTLTSTLSAQAISATAVTGTSFVIGANTLTTTEWAFLDGQDQAVKTTSSPTFVNLSLTSMATNWTNAGRTVADMGILTTVDINGGTLDGVVIGGASAAAITGTAITGTSFVIGANTLDTNEWAFLDGLNQSVSSGASPTFVNLTITSFASNWTNAGRTVADLGIITTADINGGTLDGVAIGGAAPSSGIFTSLRADTITNDTGLAAGVYSPTRSAEANLDANVTMFESQYLRVGNTVTVSGRFTADPTAGGAASFEIDLPVASNIGAVEDLAGVAFCGAIAGQGAQIEGSVANNTAVFTWVAVDTTSQSWSFTFTYQVI